MSELTEDVKAMLHEDINKSNIQGLHDTLNIILGDKENPNVLSVEFKLSTLQFLEDVQKTYASKGAHQSLEQIVAQIVELAVPGWYEAKRKRA